MKECFIPQLNIHCNTSPRITWVQSLRLDFQVSKITKKFNKKFIVSTVNTPNGAQYFLEQIFWWKIGIVYTETSKCCLKSSWASEIKSSSSHWSRYVSGVLLFLLPVTKYICFLHSSVGGEPLLAANQSSYSNCSKNQCINQGQNLEIAGVVNILNMWKDRKELLPTVKIGYISLCG